MFPFMAAGMTMALRMEPAGKSLGDISGRSHRGINARTKPAWVMASIGGQTAGDRICGLAEAARTMPRLWWTSADESFKSLEPTPTTSAAWSHSTPDTHLPVDHCHFPPVAEEPR